MNRLDKVKEVIRENIEDAKHGLFFTRNIVGDYMTNIYQEDNIEIDICYHWEYFEVFGLNSKEEEELLEFYSHMIDTL